MYLVDLLRGKTAAKPQEETPAKKSWGARLVSCVNSKEKIFGIIGVIAVCALVILTAAVVLKGGVFVAQKISPKIINVLAFLFRNDTFFGLG